MKFLYANFTEFAGDNEEAFDRMARQAAGVAQSGYEAVYTLVRGGNLVLRARAGEKLFPLTGEGKKLKKQAVSQICSIIEKGTFDFVYLRAELLSKEYVTIAACAEEKSFGAKVIFELTNYKGEGGYKKMLREKKRVEEKGVYRDLRRAWMHHTLSRSRFAKLADTVVVFGMPATRVWGVPALGLEYGITVSEIRPRTLCERQEDPVSIIGVVGDANTDGFDRVLRGLQIYQNNSHRDAVTFDIVGAEEKTAPLKKAVEEMGLENQVHFLHVKNKQELNEVCNTHTVAVSCLAFYRARQEVKQHWINRYYCAMGIPCVYAGEDSTLGDGAPFALELPDNDSPVNIALIVEFVWRCRLNPHLAQMERKFAEKNYDWRVVMKRILNFTITRRREG